MISDIKGIGPKTVEYLKKMGIESINALAALYPRRYENFTFPVSIKEAEDEAAILCKIHYNLINRGKSYILRLSDGTGELSAIWFHLPFKVKQIKRDEEYIFYGKISYFNGYKQMIQPQIYVKDDYLDMCGHLMPVYPLTAGLRQNTMRRIVKSAVEMVKFEEILPRFCIEENQLIDGNIALQWIHKPEDLIQLGKAMDRIKYEELFLYLLKVAFHSGSVCNHHPMSSVKIVEKVIENLPYRLTDGQLNAWKDVEADMTSSYSMRRMIQGDVGSGKTIISFLTLLLVVANGYQGVLMVPTEVLAKQHYQEFCELMQKNNLPYTCALLSGSVKNKQSLYKEIENGNIHVIIGTHAVIQKNVKYKKLGVVITDEEHRFGVGQREALSEKGNVPHMLIMSATPIPRSLAMSMYGDMKISVIKGLPSNRKPIQNAVIQDSERLRAWNFINMEVRNGRQAYVICPMVEDMNEDMADVTSYVREMRKVFAKDIQIERLHGKMTPDEKNDIMARFSANQIQILVSTTVVEVGVNVPNATVILVEDANLFGMSQLHQLRGRVGRGSHQSYCIFLNSQKDACERLEIMRSTNDGFVIAEEDMRLRGTGNLLGTEQSGGTGMKMADLFSDKELLETVSENLKALLRVDSELKSCPELKDIAEKWFIK